LQLKISRRIFKVLIAVVSDTHGDTSYIEKALRKIDRAKAHMIIHLGDYIRDAEYMQRRFNGRVIYVKGNCDFGSDAKSELLETIEGKNLFITHGHKYDVKHSLTRLMFKAEEVGADLVLFGHTHIAMCEQVKDRWFINPGSASEARVDSESIAFITLGENNIEVEIEEI
jgi:putative phosphoesterase